MLNNNCIPIVILHRNDLVNLDIMLNSIFTNTRYKFDVFVIDNNSTGKWGGKELEKILKKYELASIFSSKNDWILGFNLVFKHARWKSDYKYFIFSDCDIEVPNLVGKCWLERMVDEMESNACIGKLGISLSVKGIDKGEIYDKIIEQENAFDFQPSIGENKICPVDSTLAIYRPDFFVFKKFKFSIGHASLARPYYYTCRANRDFEARHLGWYDRDKTNNTAEQLEEKIICFANFAAYIEPAVFDRVRPYLRYYYKFVKPLAKIYWSVKIITALLVYYVRNFPRNINMLQNKLR